MERLPGVPSGGGAPPGAGGRLRPIVFTGSGGEYFRIWIVNLLLSILSLGIYSAWAKVRRQRYFHRNTRLAGSAFDYHARPAAILLGRIVAAAGLVVFVVAAELQPLAAVGLLAAWLIGLPWIVHRALRFRHANTSWRGIRFGFLGTVGQAYRALMLPVLAWMLVAGCAVGLALWQGSDAVLGLVLLAAGVGSYALLPLLHYRLRRYHHDNACLGMLPARFSAGAGMFYGVYLRSLVLAVALAGQVAFLLFGNALMRRNGFYVDYLLTRKHQSPVAFTLVLFALRLAPLAYVAPLREVSMMVGVFYGAWVLRERVTATRLAGVLCMIAGVVAFTLA